MGRSSAERSALTLAALLLALPAWGQGAGAVQASGLTPAAGPLSVSLTVGAGLPSDDVFGDIYGSAAVPIVAQVDWRIGSSGLGVFGGLRWVSAAGEAIVESTSRPGGERVEFGMMSWRVGPTWSVLRGPWALGAGGGLAYNSFREEWESAGLRVEDSGVGGVLQGTLERRFARRLSALLRVEYSWFEADAEEGTGLAPVGLGGIDIAGGIAIRF